ncbi:hypothetical protein BO86DRAFT_397165 [Aspergillus japonicus CBS 114.51]|uniref:Uncharacterized protein n=1 Tax=Aspergillus japonicus CBS 114.51 TaxID=1448312 RepID=A0A8T8X8H2_ASPJA|nr:hypothetical protein BO86DRAFT_397165 [Aspergillus japonicus CBS 114.51]RAH84300.1 hypothetical protein BO86DRAFT_397165 [Aspergillus japonicus CBS 114.51]
MRIDLLKLKNLYIVVFGLPNYPKLFPELTGASRERVKRLLRQIRCLWIDQYGHEFTHGHGYPSPGHDFTAWFVRALQHEMDRDPVSPPQGTMTAAEAHAFHLETIFLESIPVSPHVLRSLTTLARQTLKRVEFYQVIAYSCGWRDLLSLLNRLPHLMYFRLQEFTVKEETGNFAHTHIGTVDDVSLEDEFSQDKPADDMGPDIDLSGDVEVAVLKDIAFSRRFPKEMLPAFGRLLRHVDVNRSAAGMRPLMEQFEYKIRR